jgi:hypothetical protein
MFNLIDNLSGYKLDFMLLKNSTYHQLAFERRVQRTDVGYPVWVHSIEDLILAKLMWIQQLFSDRQMNDIHALLRYENIDREYIKNWIEKLQLNTYGLISL